MLDDQWYQELKERGKTKIQLKTEQHVKGWRRPVMRTAETSNEFPTSAQGSCAKATPILAAGFSSAVNLTAVSVMIDTGAALSIADETAVKEMGVHILPFSEENRPIPITTATKQPVMPVGYVRIPLLWGSARITVFSRVFNTISSGVIIIGNSDLGERKVVIDYKQLSVRLKADDDSMITIPVSIGEAHEQFNWPDDRYICGDHEE